LPISKVAWSNEFISTVCSSWTILPVPGAWPHPRVGVFFRRAECARLAAVLAGAAVKRRAPRPYVAPVGGGQFESLALVDTAPARAAVLACGRRLGGYRPHSGR